MRKDFLREDHRLDRRPRARLSLIRRGTAGQWEEGKDAINGPGCRAGPFLPMLSGSSSMRWPTTSATSMRTLAMPKAAKPWSLTSRREKLIKIGAKVVSHGRHVTFQMA